MNLGSLKFLIFLIFFISNNALLAKPIEAKIAEISILDKITAKVKNIKIPVDGSLKFESLSIEVYACFKNPPEVIPENFVLLKIYDSIKSDSINLIYQGWMISSSPATTPLEHPIYDLWLIDCNTEIEF